MGDATTYLTSHNSTLLHKMDTENMQLTEDNAKIFQRRSKNETGY